MYFLAAEMVCFGVGVAGSNVLYVPASPLCPQNARCVRARAAVADSGVRFILVGSCVQEQALMTNGFYNFFLSCEAHARLNC